MNRKLSPEELKIANQLLEEIRNKFSSFDKDLRWALNRKIYKELTYDERGKPAHRRQLKAKKIKLQDYKCASCLNELPESHNHLDRLNAMDGYTEANTQVLCLSCDRKKQESKKFKD